MGESQKTLYEPVRLWLDKRGFKALITGDRKEFVVSISDLYSMSHMIPDIIGVKDNKVVIVEVEKDKKRFFDALGRCMLWRRMATFVYLAFPEKEAVRAPFLKSIGLGLLEVDENNTVKESIELPYEGIGLQSIMELHPTNYKREMRLAEQIGEMNKNGE